MTRSQFDKLLTIVQTAIALDPSKCRYGSGPVTPRMQLTIALKHLAGDSSHDIEKHMGGKELIAAIISVILIVCCVCVCVCRCSFPTYSLQVN